MELTVFHPDHFDLFEPGEEESKYFDRQAFKEVSKEWGNTAFSAVEDSKVYGIGVYVLDGTEATVSLLLSDKIRKSPYFLHRIVVRGTKWLEECGVTKIKATCMKGHTEGEKWFLRLGFKPTGKEETLMGFDTKEFAR